MIHRRGLWNADGGNGTDFIFILWKVFLEWQPAYSFKCNPSRFSLNLSFWYFLKAGKVNFSGFPKFCRKSFPYSFIIAELFGICKTILLEYRTTTIELLIWTSWTISWTSWISWTISWKALWFYFLLNYIKWLCLI